MAQVAKMLEIRAPLPSDPEKLRARLEELIAAQKAIKQELNEIMGKLPPGQPVHCLRCGHTWRPQSDLMRPTACQKCKAQRWDRYPRWERLDLKGQPRYPAKSKGPILPPVKPIFVPQDEPFGLSPPPIPPGSETFNSPSTVSLRERLAQMSRVEESQSATGSESDASRAGVQHANPKSTDRIIVQDLSSGPASDGADPQVNESDLLAAIN